VTHSAHWPVLVLHCRPPCIWQYAASHPTHWPLAVSHLGLAPEHSAFVLHATAGPLPAAPVVPAVPVPAVPLPPVPMPFPPVPAPFPPVPVPFPPVPAPLPPAVAPPPVPVADVPPALAPPAEAPPAAALLPAAPPVPVGLVRRSEPLSELPHAANRAAPNMKVTMEREARRMGGSPCPYSVRTPRFPGAHPREIAIGATFDRR
jgi:hypothetical protein